MGRSAKSYTQEESVAAAKLKQKQRRATSHGKGLAKIQRYNAYHRKHGQQGSSTPPTLPRTLLADATSALPEDSYLYRQALRSTQLLDETGLDIWDVGPPYATGPPSDSPHELRHTKRLEEVMHGRYARMRRDREAEYMGDLPLEMLKGKLDQTLETWHIANAFMGSYHDGHRELAMARVWLQWVARDVLSYYKRVYQ